VRQNLQLGEKAGKAGGRWAMHDMFRISSKSAPT
jgi:hypothetical protein